MMLTKIFKAILLLIVFTFVTAVAGFFYFKHYLQEEIAVPKTLYIPKGSSKSAIMALQKNGIALDKRDYYMIKLIGYPQAGWIDLGTTHMRRGEFLYKITHAKAALQKVTLIPGETTELFFRNLAKSFDLNVTKLQASYRKHTDIPEGILIAETYRVPKGIHEEALITYLLQQSMQKHHAIARKELGHFDEKEWFGKYITIASIIQKEAANEKEMPLISAVIYNRLKRKMKLQMDGTLNYGKYSHVKVTPKRIREDNSSYNTYKIAALPPWPVCAVSIAAIKAAIHPAKTDYLYFVKGKDGKHHFSKTYKEHIKAIHR